MSPLRSSPALALMASLLWPAAPAAQSLGDIARAEAARRTTVAAPAKVLTNADLERPLRRAEISAVAPLSAIVPAILEKPRVPKPIPPVPRLMPSLAGGSATAVARMTTAKIPVKSTADVMASSSVARTSRVLPPVPQHSNAPALSADWQSFTVRKTEAELAESPDDLRMPSRRRFTSVLPTGRDGVQTGVALGYVQGADWASEVTARGSFYGIRTNFNLFTTKGADGLRYQSGQLSLVDPDFGWSADAGDLFSEIRGLRRGMRVRWNNVVRHQPSVAVYMPASTAGSQRTVLAYGHEFRLFPGTTLGGEAISDGSALVRARHAARRWDTEASYRRAAAPYAGIDVSWFGSYAVWRGVTLRASARRSHTGDDDATGRVVGIRIPLPAGVGLTYERATSTYNSTHQFSQAFSADLPVGPVRLLQRVQFGETTLVQAGRPVHTDGRRMQTVASYAPTRWASFGLQQANEWRTDGSVQSWQELHGVVRLGRRASIVARAAVPRVLNPERLNLRFSYDLPAAWGVSVEYGRIGAFQGTTQVSESERRFRIMLRKTWQTPVPARGGSVQGRIVDQLGSPVSGAIIRLGRYETVTDEAGAFAFAKVPSGLFDLSIDRDSLPADYAAENTVRRFTVTPRTRRTEDWMVVPLNAIHGRVYVDRNENGAYDEGEEVAGVVLRLADRATATTADGTYGFYNLEPGRHVIMLDVKRLPPELVPTSPVELPLDLQPHGSRQGADFQLGVRKKQIVMQELRGQ